MDLLIIIIIPFFSFQSCFTRPFCNSSIEMHYIQTPIILRDPLWFLLPCTTPNYVKKGFALMHNAMVVSGCLQGDQGGKRQKLIMNTQIKTPIFHLQMDAIAMIKHQRQRPALVVALMRTPLACRHPHLLYPLISLHPPDQHQLDFTDFHHPLVPPTFAYTLLPPSEIPFTPSSPSVQKMG
jgi:hypothetical protein